MRKIKRIPVLLATAAWAIFLSLHPRTARAGAEPDIDLETRTISVTQLAETISSTNRAIANAGDATLNWNIVEQSAASPQGGDWLDNFDSYPTGSMLHGQGGWKGWANNPVFSASTPNVQARSGPNAIDISSNADLVHKFAVSGGQWVLTAWAYSPGNFIG